MPHYMLGISLNAETTKKLTVVPEDRRAAAAKALEAIGGKLKDYFFALGRHDAIVIVEFPNNVTAAAAAMLIGATGAFTHVETTPLLTMDEAMEAMAKAGKSSKDYRPPGR